jgi:PAS domain S-box-containing protein
MNPLPDNTPTILLASSSRVEPQRLESALAQDNQRILTARDAQGCLAIYRKERPDLVIIDFELENEDAITICERLRQMPEGDDIALLGITVNSSEAITQALAAGVDDYVARPIHPLALLRRIDNLLRVHQARLMLHKTTSTETQSDEKYRNLFEAANDAIFIHATQTGRLLDVNRRAGKWLGYSRDELLQMTFDELGESVPDDEAEELTTQGHFVFERSFRTRKGYLIPAEVSCRVITHDGHQAVISIARSIHERKRVEAAANDQRRLAEALRDTAEAINSTLQLDEVVRRILEQVARVVPCEAANILLIDGDEAQIIGHRGYEQFGLDGNRIVQVWHISQTPTFRRIIENQQPLVIPDTHNNEQWLYVQDMPWVRSYIGVPIIADNRVIGFLNLDHSVPNSFHEEHGTHLQAFANQASIAIQNARLHEEVRSHAQEMEGRVAQRTLELVQANIELKDQIVERQRIEQELAGERNILRTLIDNLPDDIYIKDTDGKIILTNRAFERRMVARTADGVVLGKDAYDLAPPEEAEYARHLDQYVLDHGKAIINQEVDLPLGSGLSRHILSTRVPLRDADGHIVAIVGIDHDVSALRRAGEALREERNLLRALIDTIPDEIYVKDRDSTVILANKALARRVRHRAPGGEIIGSNDYDYIHEGFSREMVEREREFEQRLMQLEAPSLNQERSVRDENGEYLWMLTTKAPLRDSQGKIMGLIGVNRNITEVKRAEERLRHIITSARCLLWYAIVEVDDALRWDMYIPDEKTAHSFLPIRVQEDQTYAQAWRHSILPEDWQRIDEISKKAIHRQQRGYSYEFRCQLDDGQNRWLHENVQIKPLTPGRYSLVGVCTDITERKQAEATLQRANELLEQRVAERTVELIEANEILQQEITVRKRAEQAEREQRLLAEALTDTAAVLSETLDLNEVLDRILNHVARVVPPHDTASVMLIEDDIYARMIRFREYTEQGVITTAQGERFYLDSLPNLRRIVDTRRAITISDTRGHPDWIEELSDSQIRSYIGMPIQAEGVVIGFINLGSCRPGQFSPEHANRLQAFSNQAGVALQNARLFEAVRQHATELRRRVAERTAELESERAQLHAILDAMTEGVIYTDNDGHIKYINQSLERLTGYSARECIESLDQQFYSQIMDADTQQQMISIKEKVLRQGLWHGEIKVTPRHGPTFDAKWVTTLVSGMDHEPAGVVTVLRDISAEKRLEAQKARFIATASHELRTPITNLKTRLYLIEKQPDKLNNHLHVMSSVTDRMRKLVDDLLDISRFEHGIIALQHERIRLQELIEAVVQIQKPEAESKKIDLRVKMPDVPLEIWADRSRITQVITNLMTNAINYTPPDGRVEIKMSVTADGDPAARDYALLTIRDTGIGIPPDLLPDVFKPFFRINDYNTGMGLGLSIAREIIEMHEGEISVASEVNRGTVFTVRLPLARRGASSASTE